MSFATALLLGLGGYNRGRQANQQYGLEQQQQAQTKSYEDAQTAAEQERLRREDILNKAKLTASGFDDHGNPLPPVQMHLPPSLMRVVPGKVGTHYQVTPQDQLNHQIALTRFQANAYRNAGRTDYADALDANANELQKQLLADQAQTNRDALFQLAESGRDQRTAEEIAAGITRTGMTTATSRADTAANISERYGTTGMRIGASVAENQQRIDAANQRSAASIAERYNAQSSNDMRSMEKQNADATRKGDPLPYPNLEDFKAGLAPAIAAVSQDPRKLSIYLKNLNLRAKQFSPQQILYAQRQLQNAAREAQQAKASSSSMLVPPVDNAPANLGPPPPVP